MSDTPIPEKPPAPFLPNQDNKGVPPPPAKPGEIPKPPAPGVHPSPFHW